MEGVLDAPMRAFLTEFEGFDSCVSEFIRVNQDIPPKRVFHTQVPELQSRGLTLSGVPVQVQLLGGDPERMAEAAERACQAGAWGVDINFGCPAPTVNRHDGGAALLQYPERIRAIVEAVRKAVPAHLPVSAKLRLGWDTLDAIHLNADRAAEGGAAWITIHGRTKVQGYALPVYWGPIGEVRRRLAGAGSGGSGGGIPVIANGEIWTVEDLRLCRDQTGCEHFMIGRGALGDVGLAAALSAELKGTAHSKAAGSTVLNRECVSPEYWLPLFERYRDVCRRHGMGDGYILRRMKQWAGMVRIRRPLDWFDEFKRTITLEEAMRVLLSRCRGSEVLEAHLFEPLLDRFAKFDD
jgi:tRNA-dihydrouridine synthase C